MARLLKIKMEQQYSDWKECFNDFLILKMAQGVSPRTIKDYEWHLKIFLQKVLYLGRSCEVKESGDHILCRGKQLGTSKS